MNIQWYPGHMTKAKRAMKEDIKLIDLIIEVVDARVPFSSRNPDIDELGQNKARIVLLNKSDLSNERGNDAWAEWFKSQGCHVIKVNSRSGAGLKQINSVVQEACKEKIERDRRRGILNRPVRAMVAVSYTHLDVYKRQVIKIVHEELINLMGSETTEIALRPSNEITVIMMAGLQGAGKTTTTAKIAGKLKAKGRKPLLAACDVYSPAAIQQLQINGRCVQETGNGWRRC